MKNALSMAVCFAAFLALALTTGCTKPPTAPQNVKAEPVGGLRQKYELFGTVTETTTQDIQVTWDSVESADSYTIYWATKPGVARTNGTAILRATSPWKHEGLVEGQTYYYVVTVTRKGMESRESQEVSAKPGHGQMRFKVGNLF